MNVAELDLEEHRVWHVGWTKSASADMACIRLSHFRPVPPLPVVLPLLPPGPMLLPSLVSWSDRYHWAVDTYVLITCLPYSRFRGLFYP